MSDASPTTDGPAPRSTRRSLFTAGAAATLVPVWLAFVGRDALALVTLAIVSPCLLAMWLSMAHPETTGGRRLRLEAGVLVMSMLIVFFEYRLVEDATGFDSSQLLGLGATGIVGMSAALVGNWIGDRVITAGAQARRAIEVRHAGNDRAAGVNIAAGAGPCEECPICGQCYDGGTRTCANDEASLATLTVPRLLGNRYRLEHHQSGGGTATVYEATDTLLGRRVAVKLVREECGALTGAVDEFRREARALAGFSHPNVVTVFDYGVSGTQAFLVMELLQGRTLRDALRAEDQFTPARALPVLRAIAAAVDAAHRQHLLHRDLKPENVFLVTHDHGESAKVLDFGLAQLLAQAGDESQARGRWDGSIAGTPLYMAPEQLRGEEPDPSWDLWALTVMAFEMLTGSHPFLDGEEGGHDALGLQRASNGSDPRDRGVFARALAINIADRPRSTAALLFELERSVGA